MDLISSTLQPAAQKVANSLTPNTNTVKPLAAGSSSSSGSSTSAASTAGSITSNDFLTLLVTEMKNQDPTQPTDPNSYIQQLVGVNSLQQLISINQELGAATSGTSSSSTAAIAATPTSSAL